MGIYRRWVLYAALAFCFTAASSPAAQQDLSAMAKRIQPSVVSVLAYDKDGTEIARGSGFFIGKQGDVITARDIVKGADHADARTADGMSYPLKKVLAEDREANLIRASVEIPLHVVRVPPIRIGLPPVGERVAAIAGPSGATPQVSYGVVSAILEIPAFGEMLQVIVRLSPSCDGSPIISMKGEVIGVVTSANGQVFNILPIRRAVRLIPGRGKALSEWERKREKIAEELYAAALPYLWREDYEKALRFFKEAVEKDPLYANAYFQIGYCNAQLRRYPEAIEAYKRATRIRPDFVIAHFFLGLAYLELDDKNAALGEYKVIKNLDPNDRLDRDYAGDLLHMIE